MIHPSYPGFMGEQIAETASKLVPLMLLLLTVFGVLVITILVLKFRLKRQMQVGGSKRKKRGRSKSIQAGDVITVLGRAFNVTSISELPKGRAGGIWCFLEGEEGPGRLNLAPGREQANYFPGRGVLQCGPEPPGQIDRDGQTYEKICEPVDIAGGSILVLYQGPPGRLLAAEKGPDEAVLWRGKEIPAEGIEILEEK